MFLKKFCEKNPSEFEGRRDHEHRMNHSTPYGKSTNWYMEVYTSDYNSAYTGVFETDEPSKLRLNRQDEVQNKHQNMKTLRLITSLKQKECLNGQRPFERSQSYAQETEKPNRFLNLHKEGLSRIAALARLNDILG